MIIDKHNLEGLSTGELIHLADYYGIDIPSDPERIFLIEQLMEFSEDRENENKEYNNFTLSGSNLTTEKNDFPDQASLPRQYNISYMNVIIRDPLWAFVFWELKNTEKEKFTGQADFSGFYLKVTTITEKDGIKMEAAVFTVQVGTEDTSWYLGFTEEDNMSCNCLHRVDLCTITGNTEEVLVSSDVFKLPVLVSTKNDIYNNNESRILAEMSGLNELTVLRNTDRRLKIKAAYIK